MKSRRLAALLAAVALVATGCTGKNAVDQSAGGQFRYVSSSVLGKTWAPADRKKVGDFTGQLLSGGPPTNGGVAGGGGGGSYQLAHDAGKVVVVNFWASWCNPCQVETPQFDSVYRAYKAKGVDFVGIDFKDQRNNAKRFITNNDISYPIVFDQQGKTALQMGNLPALGLPFTVLIDKQQRVAAVYTQQLSPKDLEPVLNKLVAEPAPSAASTGPGA